MKHVIVAIDKDGNEALYVGGDYVPTDGPTVYAVDIANAVGDQVIQFSHVVIDRAVQVWPEKREALLPSA